MQGHMKRILFLTIFLLLSSSIQAKSCSGENIDNQISIFQAIKSVDRFFYEQSDGFKKKGKAKGQMLYTKHASLKWTPDQGEGGAFIIALDSKKDLFFIYHADNFEVKTTFYSGKLDSESCSIKFRINENEFTTLKVDDSGNMEIYIDHRKSSDLELKRMATWFFKSKAR